MCFLLWNSIYVFFFTQLVKRSWIHYYCGMLPYEACINIIIHFLIFSFLNYLFFIFGWMVRSRNIAFYGMSRDCWIFKISWPFILSIITFINIFMCVPVALINKILRYLFHTKIKTTHNLVVSLLYFSFIFFKK